MILGGLIGFLIGITFGLAQGSAWPAVLWRSSAAALIAGLLLRWWGRMWVRSLRQAQQDKLAAPSDPITPAPGPGPGPTPNRLAA